MEKRKNIQILRGYTQMMHWIRLFCPQLYHCVVKGESNIKFTEMPGRYYNLYIVHIKVHIGITEKDLSWPIRIEHVKLKTSKL